MSECTYLGTKKVCLIITYWRLYLIKLNFYYTRHSIKVFVLSILLILLNDKNVYPALRLGYILKHHDIWYSLVEAYSLTHNCMPYIAEP